MLRFNPKIAKRNARLHRLKRLGIIKPMTKAELTTDAAQAMAQSTKPTRHIASPSVDQQIEAKRQRKADRHEAKRIAKRM